MSIQTVVASLVLLHLRNEMIVTRSALAKLRKLSDEHEPRSTDFPGYAKSRPGTFAIYKDLQYRILDIEMDLIQSADAYNHLLTLVKIDADPGYIPIIKCERPLVYTRKGYIIQ